MEENKKNHYDLSFYKQLACFVIGLLVLQLISLMVTTVFSTVLIGQGISKEEIELRFLGKDGMIIFAIVYCLIFLIFIFVLIKDYKGIFNSSFKNYKNYFAGAIGLLVMLALTKFYSSIVSPYLFNLENSNQEAVVLYTKSMPWLAFIIFVFIGPICEEFTYRLGLYSFIRRKGKVLAIVLSSIIFAFIHFNFKSLLSGNLSLLINEILIIPSYIISGICLAFVYEKFSLAGSLTMHILNNFIAIIGAILS